MRRGWFGFQGNYGDHYRSASQWFSPLSGNDQHRVSSRHRKPTAQRTIQLEAGQFKEPFAQELAAGVTNIDFVERGLQSLLYPSAASAFRSPGVLRFTATSRGAHSSTGWARSTVKAFPRTTPPVCAPETVGEVTSTPGATERQRLARLGFRWFDRLQPDARTFWRTHAQHRITRLPPFSFCRSSRPTGMSGATRASSRF